MYPYIRLAKELIVHSGAPPLAVGEAHLSHHLCWPWDIDPWLELNNWRTLTLYDLGRMPYGRRMGIGPVLRRNGWGLAVAGASVRYRQRVRAFQRFSMRSCCLGWDARFLYFDQSMWRRGECTSQVLVRSAVTSAQGIVAPARLAQALGLAPQSPPLPHWVMAWIEAEASRPWPPLPPAAEARMEAPTGPPDEGHEGGAPTTHEGVAARRG